jgi:hypothetical protein
MSDVRTEMLRIGFRPIWRKVVVSSAETIKELFLKLPAKAIHALPGMPCLFNLNKVRAVFLVL